MRINPYLEIIIAATLWGLSGVFVKFANLPSTTLAFFRTAVPAILLLSYFLIRRENFKSDGSKILLLGISFLFAVKTLIVILGFQYAPINIGVIMLYTWPIFGSLFSVLILKEKIVQRNKLLLLTAFLGVIVIFINQDFSWENKIFLGAICMLISAVLHALVIVLLKKQPNLSKNKTVFYQNIMGAILFLPFLFINQETISLFQFGMSFSYGLFTGLIGFLLLFSALKSVQTSTGLHLTYIEVISAIIFSIILFSETFSWNIIIGGVLIIGSTFFLKK